MSVCIPVFLLHLSSLTKNYRYGTRRCYGIVRTTVLHNIGPLKDTNCCSSDYTGSQTKLPKILLNGNNICMVRLLELYYCKWKLYPTDTHHS